MSSTLPPTIRVESPLAGLGSADPLIRYEDTTVREGPQRGHINLRGNAHDESFTDAVRRVIGVALPVAANTARSAGDCTVCWLCPNEWLMMCAPDEEDLLVQTLRDRLRSHFASVVQISGGQTIFAFEGDTARELIAKGCPLDLHPRVFSVGQCAQTHLAKAPVLLRPTPGGIELVVRRSFADYLWRWLERAAQ